MTTIPRLTLWYFPFPGRGEAIRDAFRIGNVPFTDERIDFATFAQKKEAGELPFGAMPVLLVEDAGRRHVVSQSNGTLQRLVVDPSLYNHLDETVCTLERVLPRLDRILRDLEVFADKIARHPESIGLGGAVRPSAGLKEAPTNPSAYPTYRQPRP